MPSCWHDHLSDVAEAEPKNLSKTPQRDVIRIDSSIKAQTVRGKPDA